MKKAAYKKQCKGEHKIRPYLRKALTDIRFLPVGVNLVFTQHLHENIYSNTTSLKSQQIEN